jgi:hypothetical protein
MISKLVFFILHSLYGGGPALVDNKKFYECEERTNDLDLATIELVYEDNKQDVQD